MVPRLVGFRPRSPLQIQQGQGALNGVARSTLTSHRRTELSTVAAEILLFLFPAAMAGARQLTTFASITRHLPQQRPRGLRRDAVPAPEMIHHEHPRFRRVHVSAELDILISTSVWPGHGCRAKTNSRPEEPDAAPAIGLAVGLRFRQHDNDGANRTLALIIPGASMNNRPR